MNSILQSINLIDKPIKWLTSQNVVMAAVTILAVWGGFGNYMLYFITGMTSIPEDVYESAKIDGANGVQTFFHITLPMLAPVMKVVLMLAITGAFKDYESILVLTNGGPGNRSNVMFLYIYNLIFPSSGNTNPQIGYGALLSVVAAVIVGGVTGIYLLVSKKLDDVV
ncbi:MAG: sugar ABC transporter permease [Lachnospiraceae bacterium]|nr:sugar ABC transporter permease [Lachnospiraceae bacterium]